MLDAEKLQQLMDGNIISEEEMLRQKQRLAKRILNKYENHREKNGIVYIVLAFFLGAIGIHNFYAGYLTRGIIQFLLALISPFMLFIPLLFTSCWAMLELLFVNKSKNQVAFGGNKTIILLLRLLSMIVVALSLMSLNTSFYDININSFTEM